MPTRKFLGIILLLVAAGLAIFLIFRRQEKIPEIALQETREYHSAELGFKLSYPATWVVEAAGMGNGTIIFTNPANYQEEVVVIVVDKSVEQELLTQAGNADVASTTLASYSATELIPKEGSEIQGHIVYAVIGEKLFLLTGTSDEFNAVVASFQLLE